MARGITFDAIGVGMEKNHTLATKVHKYYRADNPEQLTWAVKKVVSEIGGSNSNVDPEEAFALVGSLPDNFVEAALKALLNQGNHPIGTTPPLERIPEAKQAPQPKKSFFSW
jgi:hypothetical protein